MTPLNKVNRNMYTKVNAHKRSIIQAFIASGAFLTLAMTGCLTVEQMAPPVSPEFSLNGTNVVTLAALEEGRDVYLSDCTRCHSVEPIDRYSIDRWNDIIERMGPRSRLDETRTGALRAYIVAAHTFLNTNTVAQQ